MSYMKIQSIAPNVENIEPPMHDFINQEINACWNRLIARSEERVTKGEGEVGAKGAGKVHSLRAKERHRVKYFPPLSSTPHLKTL